MGKKKYKIIVFHPGQQHSFKVAKAVDNLGILYKYYTAVYDKPDSLAMRIAKKLVRRDDVERFSKRKIDGFDHSKVEIHYTLLSLAVIVLSRRKLTKKFSDWLDRRISKKYGKKVAKQAIKNNVDAVICFYGNETTCFEYLKKHAPNIKRIVDCSCSSYKYMSHIYDMDIEKYCSNELKKEAKSFWTTKTLNAEMRALNTTDIFFAPSEFVKKGLLYCGVKEDRIKIIPYGTNFNVVETVKITPEKLKFIYVGQVTYRKGMHHLLKAFSEIKSDNFTLDVVGAYDKTSSLYQDYCEDGRIKFHGNVTHDRVKDLLLQSDVFVFCSLTEGMSLSCIEALSCGLPLICSTNAGANDVIKDGENGFVVVPDDIEGIKDKINFFINNKDLLPKFSQKAIETAKQFTWDNYEKNINTVFENLFNK